MLEGSEHLHSTGERMGLNNKIEGERELKRGKRMKIEWGNVEKNTVREITAKDKSVIKLKGRSWIQ